MGREWGVKYVVIEGLIDEPAGWLFYFSGPFLL
jgi:hypothetical protein